MTDKIGTNNVSNLAASANDMLNNKEFFTNKMNTSNDHKIDTNKSSIKLKFPLPFRPSSSGVARPRAAPPQVRPRDVPLVLLPNYSSAT